LSIGAWLLRAWGATRISADTGWPGRPLAGAALDRKRVRGGREKERWGERREGDGGFQGSRGQGRRRPQGVEACG
jgi:hypothetical protein